MSTLSEVIEEQIRVVQKLQEQAVSLPFGRGADERAYVLQGALKDQIGALCQLMLHDR